MNNKLQEIFEFIRHSEKLDGDQKDALLKAVKDADKELEITAFKLERTEKVKKTTAILLEETIEELEQKRKAVEEQNRELEIAKSLERVRSSALQMKKQDDLLHVGRALLKELKSLGFINIRNTQIDILNDEKGSFQNYLYSDYGVSGVTEVFYDSHPLVKQFVNDIKSAPDALSYSELTGKDFEEWREHRKKAQHLSDKKLEQVTVLYYYCYSLGTGAIGISSFVPLEDEKQEILKRFRNVFYLAYQRFIDILNSEAAAREAQIEASLERVRAIAMSMHKSNDLLSICEVSFKEFKKLGFDNLRNTIIHILNDEKGFFMDYDYSDYLGGSINKINYDSHPIVENYLDQIKKADDAFAEVVIDGSQLEGWKDFRRKGGQRDDPKLDEIPALHYYLYSIGVGDIGISTFKPINESQINILKRFRNVFDLAYRRYADITKAEAQAREAEIELALERVRARTMAMQKSEELKEVIQLVYEQFVHLKINVDHAGFVVDYTPKGDWHFWIADQNDIPSKITHPYFESVWANQFNEAKEKGEDFFATNLNFEEKNKFYTELLSYVPGLPEESKDFYLSCPGLAITTALFDDVSLYVENFSGIPYSDEENKILMRFGKVFQQTYTRFLDLQKAEAQAREAQIEAALERIRSRAMGMHKSEEVGYVSDVLFSELNQLDFEINGSSIVIVDEDKDTMELWRARSDVAVKPFESSSFKKAMKTVEKHMPDWYPIFVDALGKRENYLVDQLSGKRRLNFINAIVEQYNYSGKEKNKLIDNTPKTFSTHYIFFKLGYLALLSKKKLSDENISIVRRFVEVFEFSYARFLDIQKAEAQAREAEIQLALEKVRMVALGLKKSEEMLKVAEVLYKQLIELGFSNIRNAIIDIKNGDDDTFTDYDYSREMSGTVTQMSYHDDPTLEGQFKKMATTTNDFFELVLEGKELEDLKAMRIKNGEDEDPRLSDIDLLTYNLYSFGNGAIGISNFGVLSEEEKTILNRFSNVFTFAYKRYNDLATAEAQAREAQIEAALERVRSKTMAMHNSKDVGETVTTLFKEVMKLGLDPSIRCGIGILKGKEKMETWSATSYSNGEVDLKTGTLDMTIHPMLSGLKKAWQSGESSYSYQYIGDDVIKYYNALNNEPEYPFDVELDSLPEKEYHNSFFFSEGILFAFTANQISEESKMVLNRFANVFEQTYTRFLDLKKAEEQAREAQIEAALERVRTNAMAMQSSDDLAKIVEIVFIELKKVGFQTLRCGIGIIESAETKKVDIWSTSLAGDDLSIQISGDEILEGHPLLNGIIKHWENQTEFSYILEGDDFEKYYKTIAKTNFHIPEYSQTKKNITDEKQYYYMIPCKAGGLYAFSLVPFIDEVKKLMRRFIEVFQLAYTRYEDLKKAEAQNKIIQAENDRKTKELEEARELQLSMLPKELPQLPNLDIAVYMQTATEVGGDYYDFHLSEDGPLTAVVGDATGHGMKAGTMVTITKSLFDTFAPSDDILATFNRTSEVIKGLKFRQVSMCLLMLKIKGNELRLSSAAMPPALIYRKKSNSIEEIFMKAMPLGAINNFPYTIKESHLEKGDTILLLSDGLPELTNESNEMFGYDRTKTEFHSVGEKEPEEIVNHLKTSASQWVNGKDPDDDVTFVVIKMK